MSNDYVDEQIRRAEACLSDDSLSEREREVISTIRASLLSEGRVSFGTLGNLERVYRRIFG